MFRPEISFTENGSLHAASRPTLAKTAQGWGTLGVNDADEKEPTTNDQ
jgi:hypothetical protein